MDKREFHPVKSDIIFRLFFIDERNEEFLMSLLKSALRLPEDDYNKIEIADPHLLREFEGISWRLCTLSYTIGQAK